ncbi:hypothetical protein GCM10025762_31550 [Haloechinothrix salitolerans]
MHVTVPEPHIIGPGGPEWLFRGVFDDDLRLIGVPAGQGAPATVALRVVDAVEPTYPEVTAYFSPEVAREVAGALMAAAENAERGRGGEA